MACCRRRLPIADRALLALLKAWKASWELTDKQSATTICIQCANVIVEIWCYLDAAADVEGETASLDSLVTMMTDSSLQMSTLDLVEKLATTMPVWVQLEPGGCMRVLLWGHCCK